MGPSSGNDVLCISYNEVISIYPSVSLIYTLHCSAHLWYRSILVHPPPPMSPSPSLLSFNMCIPPPASPCQTESWWRLDTDFPTLTASKCISKFSQLASQGASSIMLQYCLQPNWSYAYISKMYFSDWEPPGVCERRGSVNLKASIWGENQTLGGHSSRPSEELGSRMTGTGARCEPLWHVWEHLGLSPNQCGNPKLTLRDAWVLRDIHSKDCRHYRRFSRCTWAIKIPSTYDA